MIKKTIQLQPEVKNRVDRIALMLKKDRNETVDVLARLWEDIFLPRSIISSESGSSKEL
ncbi:MAG: hypothetical protein HPZ91_05965 [Lentisphaeria bacterium]|nr:hypothetical protein [Lentisphaeria bacterium]